MNDIAKKFIMYIVFNFKHSETLVYSEFSTDEG